ncbi:hypothetical protein NX779_03720 [Mycoplasma cottewii]|uniref:Transmembrane protein n=1 Tax=Mycoplasma cottewii TaxID=51364 RepID=A0ABY5TW28_9MOLU|nr:hypothetical protein [Mycoplasma cottewii]UWD34888.1 hypothetical protein NX779_03720 [Mycoplasma cottewii]
MDTQQIFGNKTNINKWNAYFLLLISMIFVAILSATMLIDYNFIVVKKQNLPEEALKDPYMYFLKIWMFRYLLNVLFIIIFVVYTLFAINRLRVGYVYVGLWIIVWFGFAFGELILTKRASYLSITSIVLFVLVLISFYFIVKDISEIKKSIRYQKMKKRQYKF